MRKKIGIILCVLFVFAFVGCGHEHVWENATCTKPQTCKECGATQGNALGHTWADATCDKPKRCTVCGETEGEALGHDTDFGTCSRCGASFGNDIVSEIHTYIMAISKNDNAAMEDIINASTYSYNTYYIDMVYAASKLQRDESDLKKIIEICGDTKALSKEKSCAEAALKSIPKEPAAADEKSLRKFVEDVDTYVAKVEQLLKSHQEVAGLFTEK